ncbi:MAG: amidohydrolase family protein, partial [Acidobacteriota bacterium]|nr:amidohydrolase family protein [Acidobacteriota bacterium]
MTVRAKRLVVLIFFFIFGSLAVAAPDARSAAKKDHKNQADTIVLHGKIYTLDPKQPWTQALAIRADTIIAVGDDATIAKLRGPGTKVVDAAGNLVLPGFVDCHIHFIDGAFSLGRVNLAGAKDVPDIQQRLRDYAAKKPGTDWI